MAAVDQWVFTKPAHETPVLSIERPENNIVLNAGNSEMLKIGPDGFWVRGIKAQADDKEAEEVYNAFKAWLSWATISKN